MKAGGDSQALGAGPIFTSRDRRVLALLAGSLLLIATVEVVRATSREMVALVLALNGVTFAACVLAIYGMRAAKRKGSGKPKP